MSKDMPVKERIVSTNMRPWKTKEACKKFALDACRTIKANKIRVFQKKGFWHFEIIYVFRTRRK